MKVRYGPEAAGLGLALEPDDKVFAFEQRHPAGVLVPIDAPIGTDDLGPVGISDLLRRVGAQLKGVAFIGPEVVRDEFGFPLVGRTPTGLHRRDG